MFDTIQKFESKPSLETSTFLILSQLCKRNDPLLTYV